MRAHGRQISDLLLARQATYCYRPDLPSKAVKNVSEILAANLAAAMSAANDGRGLSQSALARLSGVPQTTISLCLRPKDRR